MKAIVVFYDTLNRRYLPCYNEEATTITPNFSRLCDLSVTFDNSYVGSMPCIPARRELHTGRYNFLHREWGPLEPYDDSMPEILKNHGIYTHLISDHLHYWEDGGSNYHTRYSSWEIVRGQEGDKWKADLHDPDIPPVVRVPSNQEGTGTASGWRFDWVNRNYIREEKDFPQTQVFDRGCEFIEKNHDCDNWLLHIETFDPHEPFYVPQKYLDMYPEDYEGDHFDWPRGDVTENEDEIRHCRRQYQALVTMCDHSLGRVLDLMDKYDLWKDTMLIVGTDHGFLLAEHGSWGKNKMPYYNEIAHTPLFIYDPRYKVQGERRESLVQMIDWMPTLLNFFHQEIPQDVQGKCLDQVITKDEKIHDAVLYGTFSGQVNITDGDYAYMRAALPEYKDEVYNYTLEPHHMTKRFTAEEMRTATLSKPFSFTKGMPLLKIKSKDKYDVNRYGTTLYDLKKDPGENCAIEDPETEMRLLQEMKRLMEETDAPEEQYVRYGLDKI